MALPVAEAGIEPSCAQSSRLRAADVDLPARSGKVNAQKYLSPHVLHTVSSPSDLFPCGLPSPGFRGIDNHDRLEYARLVMAKLSSVTLQSLGAPFLRLVKKALLRCAKYGMVLRSPASAARPPVPPHLLSPTSLLGMHTSRGKPFQMSKRDGRCLFDQLAVPRCLIPWFGRPPVRVSELMQATGESLSRLQRLCPHLAGLGLHSLVFPCSKVWPMGFPWSSCIAQSVMLSACHRAGLHKHQQLSDDLPTPNTETVFGLATDDIVHFTTGRPASIRADMRCLENALLSMDIERHSGKDVTGVLDGCAIGIDLVKGYDLHASRDKLRLLVPALLAATKRLQMTPIDVSKLLGHIEWFNLLNRPLFSCLDALYGFTRMTPSTIKFDLPVHCKREFAMVLSLCCYWSFDLTKPFSRELVATDASTSYGFGVSRLRCSRRFSKFVGRLSSRRGDFISLLPELGELPSARLRLGKACHLPLRQSNFSTVVGCPFKHVAHPGVLEAHGVRLALQWIGRTHSKYGTRQPLLIDAQAILGAVAKGRSSAYSIKRIVRHISAMALAMDIIVLPIYIPSEFNPADKPSRGPAF